MGGRMTFGSHKLVMLARSHTGIANEIREYEGEVIETQDEEA